MKAVKVNVVECFDRGTRHANQITRRYLVEKVHNTDVATVRDLLTRDQLDELIADETVQVEIR